MIRVAKSKILEDFAKDPLRSVIPRPVALGPQWWGRWSGWTVGRVAALAVGGDVGWVVGGDVG